MPNRETRQSALIHSTQSSDLQAPHNQQHRTDGSSTDDDDDTCVKQRLDDVTSVNLAEIQSDRAVTLEARVASVNISQSGTNWDEHAGKLDALQHTEKVLLRKTEKSMDTISQQHQQLEDAAVDAESLPDRDLPAGAAAAAAGATRPKDPDRWLVLGLTSSDDSDSSDGFVPVVTSREKDKKKVKLPPEMRDCRASGQSQITIKIDDEVSD